MNCPICGESFVQDQQSCRLCNYELNSKILFPGSFSDVQKVKWETDRNQRIDDYVETILRLSFKNGIFDEDCFKNGTSHITGFDLSNKRDQFLKSYEINFRNLANQVLQREVSRLVNSEISSILLLDCDPKLLTLCRVVLNGEEFVIDFSTIVLDASVVNLDGISNKDIAIVGGYREITTNLADRMKESWKTTEKNPTSVLLCSRIFGGKLLSQIKNILQNNITSNVIDAPYLLGEASTFHELIENLLNRAPLPYDLYLLTANIGVDGTVTSTSCPLFPQSEFLDSKSITVKSYNHENEIDLVIVRHKDRQRVIVKSWKMNLDFGKETTVVFAKPSRKTIEVTVTSRFSITQTHIDLEEIEKSIPKKVTPEPVKTKIDFVLIIDTIANEEELRERCESGKRIIQKLTTEAEDIQFSFSVLAYGDRKPSDHKEKGYWPEPLRKMIHRPHTEILDFLTELRSTELLRCDYESALDETLQLIEQTYLNDESSCLILTIGCRPPHPHISKIIPNTNQKPSRNGIDWERIVSNMKKSGVISYAMICPETWPEIIMKDTVPVKSNPIPHYAEGYKNAFWEQLGFSGICSFIESDETQIIQQLIKKNKPQFIELRIPEVLRNK